MRTQGQSGNKLICRMCLDQDGAASSATVRHLCTNERTGKKFHAFVCADSDDLARVFRFDLAQDSEMISPSIPI